MHSVFAVAASGGSLSEANAVTMNSDRLSETNVVTTNSRRMSAANVVAASGGRLSAMGDELMRVSKKVNTDHQKREIDR